MFLCYCVCGRAAYLPIFTIYSIECTACIAFYCTTFFNLYLWHRCDKILFKFLFIILIINRFFSLILLVLCIKLFTLFRPIYFFEFSHWQAFDWFFFVGECAFIIFWSFDQIFPHIAIFLNMKQCIYTQSWNMSA